MWFLELAEKPGTFEKVDEFVYKNRETAVSPNGQRRYTDHYVLSTGNSTKIVYNGSPNILPLICRMLGLAQSHGLTASPIYSEPEHIHFVGRSSFLYDLSTGNRYKRVNK